MSSAVVHLRRGRVKPVWSGHPWVFAGSIDRVDGEPADGDLVRVQDPEGNDLGTGFWNGRSALRVRILARGEGSDDVDAVLRRRVADAVALRQAAGVTGEGNAWRVLHAEGDGVPGAVVDRYGDWLVVQVSVLGLERHLDALVDALVGELSPRGVFLRAGARHAEREGVDDADRLLYGEAPPETVWIEEHGVAFGVDLRGGSKTGHYTDQRGNRRRFAPFTRGRRVLDAFCGTGGFGLHALVHGGAEHVAFLDGSAASLAALRANAERNAVAERCTVIEEDAFDALRRLDEERARFGAVILDPPRLADHRKRRDGARRAHRELHRRALGILEPGGHLATAACSGVITDDDFEDSLRRAAADARCRVQVLHRAGQDADHPWSVVNPEGRYLRYLMARVSALD